MRRFMGCLVLASGAAAGAVWACGSDVRACQGEECSELEDAGLDSLPVLETSLFDAEVPDDAEDSGTDGEVTDRKDGGALKDGKADGEARDARSDGEARDGGTQDGGIQDGGATEEAPTDTGSDDTTPPRPIAPLSTSRVTSRRPKLHWELPSGVADATVDLCSDRACTEKIGASAHVTGTSYAPTVDLPTGVVYWRLHPGTVTSVTSPTWEFTVGHLSAPVDTSWGTTLDVNGDGYADVAVGAQFAAGADGGATNAGAAYVYLGSANGLATTPTTLYGPDGASGNFGGSVASAGDVNGDGYADLVVGASSALSFTGGANIYFGSATGLATTPAITLTGPDGAGGEFGTSVASAGDVNGDGYADLVIGTTAERAYVYLGGASGLATSPATTLVDANSPSFGASVASIGDVNGDGYADLVVGAFSDSSFTGSVHIYLGGKTGLATSPATTLTGPDGMYGSFGSSVASAGDVNGDGYADLIVGAYAVANDNDIGTVYVYGGSEAGLIATPVAHLTDPGNAADQFGYSVASAGDVNGDGYADVVVGAEASTNGSAYIYAGSSSGIANSPATTLNGFPGDAGIGAAFGYSVASAGDVTGDSYSDVIVGAYAVSGAYVYLGGKTDGLATSPAVTLSVGSGTNAYFGWSVFGASN